METQIQFKLDKKEKEALREYAHSLGLSVSAFVRFSVFEKLKKECDTNGERTA